VTLALPDYDNPKGLGKPLSEYSHVARAGNVLTIAGQCGIDEDNVAVGPDITSQTRQTFENIRMALESQGASLRHVVRFTTYLTSVEVVRGFYAERERYFSEHYGPGPYAPNALLVIKSLVLPELLIEIEATAVCDDLA
jgi:enamine deaminase RidA (YjgF/YER057c/UK114 family)